MFSPNKLVYFGMYILFGMLLLCSGEKANASASMIIGVGVHRLGDYRYQSQVLPLVRQVGMTSIRTDISWSGIERVKGVYEFDKEVDRSVDFTIQQGIEPLLILDYGNPLYDNGKKPISKEALRGFVNYAQAVVRHFGHKVRYYEIWNEWENGLGNTEPGHIDDYAALVKATYPAIKSVNPHTVVLVGAFTTGRLMDGWYERLAFLGALNTADGLSVHPYVYQPPSDCAPEHAFTLIDELVETLRSRYALQLPIYITEIGWPTNQGKSGASESVQAQMLERTLSLAAARPYVRGVWWYDLVDDGNDPSNKEANFGLLHYMNLDAKPAWSSMNKMTSQIATHPAASTSEMLVPSPAACTRQSSPIK
ncbi:cellulase family glycosylhydrolase [Paraburkholderia sediminicola]|uniref:cellulase family glycosylhydrolase n=1 Tax=Paraburkholderia sediminicola TaxID=458836 RepID=UPI0038BCEDA7